MKHKLVFLSIILLASTINGMKRKRTENTFSIQTNKKQHRDNFLRSLPTIQTNKKQYRDNFLLSLPTIRINKKQTAVIKFSSPIICTNNKQDTFTKFLSLPKDIQFIIIDSITNKTTAATLIIATRTINALARTNKLFNLFINKPTFSNNLIKKIANSSYCSHETIAQYLHTQASNNQLNLQQKFKQIYSSKSPLCHNAAKLDELIKYGINLDFTLNYGILHQTTLMIATQHYHALFNYLIRKNINPNASNAHKLTALHIATQYPIDENTLRQILNHPLIIIDQPNIRGETALLKCLINRRQECIINKQKNRITPIFIRTIRKLISKGANPEHANNAQLTPLAVAEELKNQEVIDIIKEAIAKNHAPKS